MQHRRTSLILKEQVAPQVQSLDAFISKGKTVCHLTLSHSIEPPRHTSVAFREISSVIL